MVDSGTLWHCWQLQPGGGWSGWKSLGQPRLGSEVLKVDDVTVAADGSGGLVVFATSSAPGSAPGLWLRTQVRAAEPWGDWQFPLSSGSATALPVGGPVLTLRGTQLVLLVRETGTANMYVVRQMDPDPGDPHQLELRLRESVSRCDGQQAGRPESGRGCRASGRRAGSRTSTLACIVHADPPVQST